eukprot:304931-Amphidinium_carterae.1
MIEIASNNAMLEPKNKHYLRFDLPAISLTGKFASSRTIEYDLSRYFESLNDSPSMAVALSACPTVAFPTVACRLEQQHQHCPAAMKETCKHCSMAKLCLWSSSISLAFALPPRPAEQLPRVPAFLIGSMLHSRLLSFHPSFSGACSGISLAQPELTTQAFEVALLSLLLALSRNLG